jgi:hypothetical protein
LIAAISDALETPSLTQFTIILSSGRIPAASLIVLASIALPAPHGNEFTLNCRFQKRREQRTTRVEPV